MSKKVTMLFGGLLGGFLVILIALSVLQWGLPVNAQGPGSALPMNIVFHETTTPMPTAASREQDPAPTAWFPSGVVTGAGVMWSDPTYAGDKFEHPKQFEFYCDVDGDEFSSNIYSASIFISPNRLQWFPYANGTGNTCAYSGTGNLNTYISGTIQGVWVRVRWSQSSTPSLSPNIWMVLRGTVGRDHP